MGAGKSTIGRLLAMKFGYLFLDLDQMIEGQEGKSIPEIFESKGEIYFRKAEHLLLKDTLTSRSNLVLSLGGGTPCYANNYLLYQRDDCISIYLKASISTLQTRLHQDTTQQRPLLQNLSMLEREEFIAKQLFERSFYYNQAQNVVVVDGKTPNEIANEIFNTLI
ncbi:MAG: shikimate kinase [Flavobacterium sp.]|nr:shikimate kinase [Flavobacterium sp.]